MKITYFLFRIMALLLVLPATSCAQCSSAQVEVQVLGSGGPELDDQRASSSYLIWLDGKAVILIDTGSDSSLNFEKSGAAFNDLDAILFTHFHVDHSADLPAYIKGGFFTDRSRDLPVYGPEGNHLMPSTENFLQSLFGGRGAYRYLSEYFLSSEDSAYKLKASSLSVEDKAVRRFHVGDAIDISAVPVHHGPIPALAWRIDVKGCSITFSGDMSNRYHSLARLARGSDILVAHNAIPESATGVARNLHMPPSEIGRIAAKAGVRQLVLSHRMLRSLGREKETERKIRRYYQGPLHFANDLDCFTP